MIESIRVLVVESQAIVRCGLTAKFKGEPDIKVVGEAEDDGRAIEEAARLRPDVVLTEVYLPRLGGLKAIAAIKERLPGVRVLVLTSSEMKKDYLKALKLGVQGYLIKSATFEEILSALRKVAAGGTAFPPCDARRVTVPVRRG